MRVKGGWRGRVERVKGGRVESRGGWWRGEGHLPGVLLLEAGGDVV